ncbi:membrane or secreted protein [Robertkochia sediminum]|uniref:membrane or secreted protein n=1 Tax=Robertkochia sediminum TaxID=2785326 RepID=UPI0019348846|nr:membrane or secreted protein [Robertkochia sediminum]MBL7472947.1 membrane or secreted protein [Robertkochia sediminum]
MKTRLFSLYTLLFTILIHAQAPVGAWEAITTDEQGLEIRMVGIITENHYQVLSRYEAQSGKFIDTNGGRWSLDGNTMTEIVEFDSSQNERVGDTITFQVKVTSDTFTIIEDNFEFHRIDDGTDSPLAGAWFFTGRKRNGEIQTRDPNLPRRTMKILSSTRFQWIAYNTETKSFMGTGGGTYTAKDGIYTENIEFFSRDDSRVGAQLEFQYEIKEGNWHHSGKNSKGEPLYEIWTRGN